MLSYHQTQLRRAGGTGGDLQQADWPSDNPGGVLVEILSVHLFVRLSAITSYSFPCSDSKLTQPLPWYPMSAIHVSHDRQPTSPPSQSTGPPMNRIILRTLLAQYGLIIIPTSRQTPYIIYCDIVDTDIVDMDMVDMNMVDIDTVDMDTVDVDMVDVDMDMEDEGRGEYFFRVLIFQG